MMNTEEKTITPRNVRPSAINSICQVETGGGIVTTYITLNDGKTISINSEMIYIYQGTPEDMSENFDDVKVDSAWEVNPEITDFDRD